MRIEALAARLFALRALVVFMAAFMLFAGLMSGAWAGGSADAWPPLDNPVELSPAPRSASDDGRLDLQLDDAGDVALIVSPALSWRLELAGNGLPYREGYIFSIRPAAVPAEESPCGAGEICPAGYATPATSRQVKWEPIEFAGGTPVVRAWITVTLPLDLAWVDFLSDLEAAAADACRDGFRAARDGTELRRAAFAPRLTFPLKAAVFAGPHFAETEIPLTLACWGGGFSRDEILAAPLPPSRL